MAGEVLNMSDLTLNECWCKLKDLCFKTSIEQLPLKTIKIIYYDKKNIS